MLWIVSELFPPEETSTAYIMGEIARKLSQKCEVGVICGPMIYDNRKQNKHRPQSDKAKSLHPIIRCQSSTADKNTTIGKIRRLFSSAMGMLKAMRKNVKEGDKVLMVTNPVTLVPFVARLRVKKNFEWNLLVHDVFPENTKAAGMNIPKPIYKRLQRLFASAISRVDNLIVLGRDMKEVMGGKLKNCAAQPKIQVIENWADLADIGTGALPQGDKIKIQYAGNIGKVQGLQQFLKVFADAGNPNLAFDLWGTGSAENDLKKQVEEPGIQHVSFHGPYLRSEQNQVLHDCDIALVTLADGMYGLGVPSKSYNIMAAGKPILYIGHPQSEIALCVKENGIGWVFDPSDTEGLKQFLKELSLKDRTGLWEKGLRSREVAERDYSKEEILNKFASII